MVYQNNTDIIYYLNLTHNTPLNLTYSTSLLNIDQIIKRDKILVKNLLAEESRVEDSACTSKWKFPCHI